MPVLPFCVRPPGGAFWLILILGIPARADTFLVVNDAGSGPGSFRQAVLDAAAVPVEATAEIQFDAVFFEEPRVVVLEDRLPVVKRSLVIDGPALGPNGEPRLTISGDRNRSGAVDDGDVPGLQVETPTGGTLTLRRLAMFGCRSTAAPGGAVFFRPVGPAALLIDQCVFTRNVGRWGGAVSMGGDGHVVTVRDSLFIGNWATDFDGGALHLGSTPAVVDRCDFRQNSGPGGGAIHTFHGAAELRECFFEGNEARGYGRGGAISARWGVRLLGCTLAGNRAWGGGAVYLSQMLAPAPGAVIENSTFSGNEAMASSGGAIYAVGAEALLRHCTLTLNHANRGATPNAYASGGGIAVPGQANQNRVRLHNCVISDNRVSGSGPATGVDLQGPEASFLSLGGNVIGVGDSLAAVFSQPGDKFGSSSQALSGILGPLASNGGPLPTHLPHPESPVINSGVPGPEPVVSVDQRGVARPGGASPDAGAVELVTLGYPEWVDFFLSSFELPSPGPGHPSDLSPMQRPEADPDGDGVPNIREYLSGGDPLTPSWDVVPRVRVDTTAGHFALRYLVAAHVVPGTIDVAFELSETGERWTPVDPAPPSRLVGYQGSAREMEVVFPGITSPTHFARMTVRLVVDDPE